MAESTSSQTMPPGPASPGGEPRYLVLLALTVIGGGFGAVLVGTAVGALLSFLPSAVGFALGFLLAGTALPLFLALRAAAALKRKGRGTLLRRLVVLLLIGATQLALFGAVMQWSSRTTGHLAMTAWEVIDVGGSVPFLSDFLYEHAERQHANRPKPGSTAASPDAGPAAADGGTHAADAGPLAADGGTAGPGATHVGADGGVPATTIPSSRGPAPARPKPGVALSPRSAGKAVRTFAAGVQTNAGDSLLLVETLAAGGAVSTRVVDLGALEKLGPPTLVECADDGTVAALLGGRHLVVARTGKPTAEVVKALAPGQKLNNLEVQAVRDVVIGPGGSGLAVVELLGAAEAGELRQALVALPKGGGAPVVLRKAGDKVPGATTDATVARSWALKKSSGAAAVLVVESYLEGGDDLATRLSGEEWTVNPQRLLVVNLDAPRALLELARTGLETSGVAGRELQIFGDAWLLPDGRAVFDANFLEKGAEGWLFVHKPGVGVFALVGDKRETDGALWPVSPPRLRGLEATADGTLVFRRADGAAVLTSIDRPGEGIAAMLGADALAADGKKIGTITGVDVPILARGGEWLIASVQLAGETGGTREALVLQSRADVQNGKAEVLLVVGGPVPGTSTPQQLQSLQFLEGREELLWQR